MCIHICLASSLHEKSHINVYLQTRLMIYVLVQCSILCSFKIQYILMFNKFLVRLHGEYNILVKLCGNTRYKFITL